MTQEDRDRLVALKKAKKKLITQKQAAVEIRRYRAAGEATASQAAEQRRRRDAP